MSVLMGANVAVEVARETFARQHSGILSKAMLWRFSMHLRVHLFIDA